MDTRTFENGFESWYETFYLLTKEIILRKLKGEDQLIEAALNYGGIMELCSIVKKWTDEFEELNKGRNWDGEWMDEVNEFFRKKLEK